LKLHAVVLSVISVLIAANALGANDKLAKAIDAYIGPVAKARDFSGVVLVAKGDHVLAERKYGRADFDLAVPFSEKSRFRTASITKTFTAAAISILAERGKLAYSDPVSKFLPRFPSAETVQLRHLLLHTSGVGNPTSPTCADVDLEAIIGEIAATPLAFEPGTRSRYSNGGYALLARVIEVASGKSWADFIRDDVAKPAGLLDTMADSPATVIPGRVRGYVPAPGRDRVAPARCEGAWAAFGSGAILSSARDLHRWARAIRDEKLFRRKDLEHPYGWGARKYFDRDAIEQSGIVNGFSTYVAAYLADDSYVVVLSNIQNGLTTTMGKGVAALLFGAEPEALRVSPPEVGASAAERAAWVGKYQNPNIATIEVSERGGLLKQRWGNSPDFVYLTPTAARETYNRQDSIALELTPEGNVVMRWPDGKPNVFTPVRNALAP
jgi:CubicO group peptidase (beta-lactamase class C family)